MLRRLLESDRVSAVDPATLICQLGASSAGYESPEIDSVVIPFYYAVGTDNQGESNATARMDPVEQFNLEQLIYESVARDIPWCYSYQDPSEAARRQEEETDSGKRVRRLSGVLSPAASAHPNDKRGSEGPGRRLTILSVAAGPTQGDVGT
jgi:hypothetical protein